jgi:hypothetical protein
MSLWYDKYKSRYDPLKYPTISSIKEQFEEELNTFIGTKAAHLQKEKEIVEQVQCEYRKQHTWYYAEQNKIISEWVEELYSYYKAPKEVLDLAYSIAYEQGHSSGHSEVESIFEDIVDKLIECYELGVKDGKIIQCFQQNTVKDGKK